MSALNFQSAKVSVSQYNLMLVTLVLIYASPPHFLLTAQLQVLRHCLAPSSKPLNMEEEEAFTTLGHRATRCHIWMGAVSKRFVVSYSPLSLKEYWLNIFVRILVAATYFVFIQDKTLLWNLGGQGMYTSWFNEWSTLGTGARVAALVQNGVDTCKAGCLGLE